MEWMPENPYKEYIAAECVYEDWLEDDGRKERFCADLKREGFAEGCQQTARNLVEWLEEPCNNPKHSVPCEGVDRRRCCSECMEQLCKAIVEADSL